MAFRLQITPKKSAQLNKGSRASFYYCEKCHSNVFDEKGLFFKSLVCMRCGYHVGKSALRKDASFKRSEEFPPGSKYSKHT